MSAIAFRPRANLWQQVPNWYGSFGASVLGSQRVAVASVVAPWASFLNYGPVAADGTVEAFSSFDHCVMDDMAGAQAVQALERMLHGPVLAELQACAASS
jgi:hypothetical protein